MELQGTARSERERLRESWGTLRNLETIHDGRGPIGPPGFEPIPNVPPFPNITSGGPLRQRVEDTNRNTGSPRTVKRAADAVEEGARDGRLAGALGIEDRTPIASPLGRDLSL